MARKTLHDIEILGVKHAGVSKNGNSYYEVTTDQGTFKTAQNGTASQQVQNGSLVGEVLTVELTGRGTIKALYFANGEYV